MSVILFMTVLVFAIVYCNPSSICLNPTDCYHNKIYEHLNEVGNVHGESQTLYKLLSKMKLHIGSECLVDPEKNICLKIGDYIEWIRNNKPDISQANSKSLLYPIMSPTKNWVTSPDGKLFPALQQSYQDVDGGVVIIVLSYCGGFENGTILWFGTKETSEFFSVPSWLNLHSKPIHSQLKQIFLHVGIPLLCELLPQPQWLGRIEELLLLQSAKGMSAFRKVYPDDNSIYDLTYGEMSLAGSIQIVNYLFEVGIGLGSQDVVVDLGSGNGAFVLFIAMASTARAFGIEIDFARYLISTRTLKIGKQMNLLIENEIDRVDFIYGDAFVPGRFANATHIYMLSTTWSDQVYGKFLHAVTNNDIKNMGRLRVIITSRSIPTDLLQTFNTNARNGRSMNKKTFQQIDKPAEITVPTSWTIHCTIYIYHVIYFDY